MAQSMRPDCRIRLRAFGILTTLTLLSSGLLACQSTGGVSGNENGSAPVNEQEANEYKKAVNRCYKTGGTRVVKIMGNLRCY